MMRQHLRMYLVLGSVNCIAEPEWVVQEAIVGGATMVQFGKKGELRLPASQGFSWHAESGICAARPVFRSSSMTMWGWLSS